MAWSRQGINASHTMEGMPPIVDSLSFWTNAEAILAVLGFLGTVIAAWWRATRWCIKFVTLHETLNEEIKRIRVDVGVLVDQMHELATVVRQSELDVRQTERAIKQNERDTERLELRFDTLNGKYPKN